jgi:hypothetical protein
MGNRTTPADFKRWYEGAGRQPATFAQYWSSMRAFDGYVYVRVTSGTTGGVIMSGIGGVYAPDHGEGGIYAPQGGYRAYSRGSSTEWTWATFEKDPVMTFVEGPSVKQVVAVLLQHGFEFTGGNQFRAQ